MSIQKTPLEPGHFYHIYNRGINGCPLFIEKTNYEHFIGLYLKHISPVAKTFAWVLMGNHFHFLVFILDPDNTYYQTLLCSEKRINQQFSNLFNAYTKAFNKKYSRTGSLFEHGFRRKRILDEANLKNVLVYIHNNPVHHGFCKYADEYPWSSFQAFTSNDPGRIVSDEAFQWFPNRHEFYTLHSKPIIETDAISAFDY
ncbi:MAG: hypothetical protein KKD74_07445 [Bacteroidetes bacterium]|nr:hypothetical protein [Bacteroidota bacterium]